METQLCSLRGRNLSLYIRVDLGYDVMKRTEYFLSLQTSVVITEQHNVTGNSEELICTAEYSTL